jgi:SOS-response transcriptional repressor LexA
MEPKFFPGDIVVLMPTYQPRNGSLVVARWKVKELCSRCLARDQTPVRICTHELQSVFQPIEVGRNVI